jgi:outer membrane protein assembly factor BamA
MQFYYNANYINYNLDYLKFRISLNTLNDNYFPTKGIVINSSLKSTFNVHFTKGSSSYLLNNVKDRNLIFNFKYKQYIYILKHLSIIPSINFGVMESPEFITEKFFLGGINYSLRSNAFNFPGIKSNYITSDDFLMYGLNGQYRLFKDWYLNGGVNEMYFMNYANYENEDDSSLDNTISSWNFGIGTSTKIGPLRLIVSQSFNKPKNVYWSFSIGVPF